jgi:hypothetical protein
VAKGILITTSRLTKDALRWITKNEYRIFHIGTDSIEQELKDVIDRPQSYDPIDLPF